jgi:coenzyme F420-reducing hydrogenase gamma subunit
MSKPRVGIFGLTGCAGDQLVVLNCEDQLLDLAALIDIRDFLMASSAGDQECVLDVAFVEGAVLTTRDAEVLRAVRQRSGALVALGTCAVWGGVAAMDRGIDRGKALEEVYGERGLAYDSYPAQALHEIVKVDINITGCPIEKSEFLETVASLLNGDQPVFPGSPVCTECRMRENNCLLIERGEICCGPITAGGCDARCPALRIPCIGCRGPLSDSNTVSALDAFVDKGFDRQRTAARLRTFAAEGAAQ